MWKTHGRAWLVDTLEGGHIVCPGDWIITGVKGEKYPCKPDIFELTYHKVDALPPSRARICEFLNKLYELEPELIQKLFTTRIGVYEDESEPYALLRVIDDGQPEEERICVVVEDEELRRCEAQGKEYREFKHFSRFEMARNFSPLLGKTREEV